MFLKRLDDEEVAPSSYEAGDARAAEPSGASLTEYGCQLRVLLVQEGAGEAEEVGEGGGVNCCNVFYPPALPSPHRLAVGGRHGAVDGATEEAAETGTVLKPACTAPANAAHAGSPAGGRVSYPYRDRAPRQQPADAQHASDAEKQGAFSRDNCWQAPQEMPPSEAGITATVRNLLLQKLAMLCRQLSIVRCNASNATVLPCPARPAYAFIGHLFLSHSNVLCFDRCESGLGKQPGPVAAPAAGVPYVRPLMQPIQRAALMRPHLRSLSGAGPRRCCSQRM